mmetsp:Transcript_6290/g.18471  ORF Transcript_6290/g.18471 Transcript_6290/m.18471 type:complete len:93 (-) Transcript_6290:431-709(-)
MDSTMDSNSGVRKALLMARQRVVLMDESLARKWGSLMDMKKGRKMDSCLEQAWEPKMGPLLDHWKVRHLALNLESSMGYLMVSLMDSHSDSY